MRYPTIFSSIRAVIPVLLLLAALPASADTAAFVELDAASQARAGVVVRPVLERSFGDQIRVVGQVVRSPGATVVVKTILEGRVEKIHVAPGDPVTAGQPLLELHSHSLHQLQGEALRAHEALELAKTRVEAGHQLLELEGISQLEVKRREQEELAARLELRQVEAELEDLGYTEAEIRRLVVSATPHPTLTVRAPAPGVVLALPVQEHGWIAPYEPLLSIGDPGRLELELQIPPAETTGIRRGDRVEFVPVGRPELPGSAQVITPVPEIDPRTRTVTIRAALEKGSAELLPGLFVEGTLTRGESQAAPSVPERSVIRMGASDYVFIRRDPLRFEARPVRLGRFNGSRYEILEGLEGGEEVAVEGVFLLKSALVRGAGEEG